jgi:biotin carboxylase
VRKRLLFIEANTTGTGMLALNKARALGFAPLFLTHKPARYQGLEQTGCPTLICETNTPQALKTTIELHVQPAEMCGITTTSEFYLETVALLAGDYGLVGNSPLAVARCRDKARTRLRLQEAGVAQPRFAIISDPAEIEAGLKTSGLPCVVKPVDDTGSHDVLYCQTHAQVEAQVARILGAQTNVRGQQSAHAVLLEEFLDAPEYSVETLTWQGKTTCVGVTEKQLTGFPAFVESGHIFPAPLAPEVLAEMTATVVRALEALEISSGPTHTEVKWTARGCAIIEVNARLAGGMIPELIRYTTGRDLVEEQLKMATGQPPAQSTRSHGYAGIAFLTAAAPGLLEEIRGGEKVRALQGIAHLEVTAARGARVVPPTSSYDRLGYIIACGQTYPEVASRLQEALATLEFVIRPCEVDTGASTTPR